MHGARGEGRKEGTCCTRHACALNVLWALSSSLPQLLRLLVLPLPSPTLPLTGVPRCRGGRAPRSLGPHHGLDPLDSPRTAPRHKSHTHPTHHPPTLTHPHRHTRPPQPSHTSHAPPRSPQPRTLLLLLLLNPPPGRSRDAQTPHQRQQQAQCPSSHRPHLLRGHPRPSRATTRVPSGGCVQ